MSAEAIAIAGVGVALLAILVPIVVAQGRRLDQRLDVVAAELRRALDAQGESLRAAMDAQGESLRAATDAQGASLHREIDALRADVGELRRDVHALSDRVARIEGALTGPWRPPTNGTPASAPPSETPPEPGRRQ